MNGFPKLAGVAEVAALAGVSRQRAHTLTRHPQFPDPVDVLAQGPVWREADVKAFLAAPRPPGRPRKNREGEVPPDCRSEVDKL